MEDLQEHELGKDNDDGASSPVRGLDERPGAFEEASIVDLLQQDVEELALAKEVYIPVKGYERTGLQICYHLPERGKELEEIASKVRREVKDSYSRNLTTAMDVMIHLCSGIYVQPPGVDEPVMLDPDNTGAPVQFDQALAELIGLPDPSTAGARRVLRKLFGNNDIAVIAHSERLNRWLANTKADISLEAWQTGE